MADFSSVLLVEDDDGDAYLVTDMLGEGAPEVDVVRATTLAQARTELAAWQPDVVLIDLGLPDASGLSAVDEIVAASDTSAVVVLTGLGDEERGAAAVSAGAQDFLVKGQVNGPTLARALRYAVQRRVVDATQRERIAALVRAEENARLERGLLPAPSVRDPRLRLSTHYRPGRHQSLLGGDFYDIVETPDGRLHVVVGDVAGHGPDSAALGVLLRGAWRALVLSGVERSEVLPQLSNMLCLERESDEMFATAIYLTVGDDRRHVEVFNAGHPRPLSLTGEIAPPWPDRHGPILGVPAISGWRSISVDLADGWPLMLYTDGLIEGGNGEDRLGEDGLCTFLGVEMALDPDIATLPRRVLARVESANRGALADDVAIVVLDVGEVAG